MSINERMFWEFMPPKAKSPITLEHRGITPEEAADFLVGQGALETRACSCCGHKVPVNGTRVRLVRTYGGAVQHVDGVDTWVPATTVPGEWRTYPLSRKGGGN